MQDKRKYIAKNTPLPTAQDLQALKAAGIELAQKFSGDIWTDYNDHDPGVTILENLCYAMMEMSYKANLDFEELFFAKGDPRIKMDLKSFFLLEEREVQYSHPVTPLDYRKLLLDHVSDQAINNCWVVPSADHFGYYEVFVHLRKAPAAREIEALFNQYRNIGERCETVQVLAAHPIQEYIRINHEVAEQLSEAVMVDSIAQFLHEIKVYVEPPIRFAKAIKDLKLTREQISQLRQGPLPSKKFIHPEDLERTALDKMKEEMDLAYFVAQNAGKWHHLIEIDPQVNQNTLQISRLNLADKEIAVFDVKDFVSQLKPKLSNKVTEAYQLKTAKPLLNGSVEWDTYLPQSNLSKQDLADYFSVQFTFPQNYNLGLEDLSSLKGKEQKQIRNLQAYLLLFESLFADFLVKLISFPELLKINAKSLSTDIETQFVEVIKKIPGDLIKDKAALKDIYVHFSFNQSRQIKIREYALVRYGEVFDLELLKRAWGEPENFEEDWLKQLDQLMVNYTSFSQGRHNSFNITDPTSDFPLSRKLSILLNQAYDETTPNVYLVEANLLSLEQQAKVFDVAVVVDLDFNNERETPNADEEKNELDLIRRQKAITELIEQELPFHLNLNFAFLTSGDAVKKIQQIEEVFPEEGVEDSTNILQLERTAFLTVYKDWRDQLANMETGDAV